MTTIKLQPATTEQPEFRLGTAKYLKRLFENNKLVIGTNSKNVTYAYLQLHGDFVKTFKRDRIFIADNSEEEYNQFSCQKLDGFYFTNLKQSGKEFGNEGLFDPTINTTNACNTTFSELKKQILALLEKHVELMELEDSREAVVVNV